MSGFGANAGELSATAGSVRSAADPLRDKHSKDVADIEVAKADFGEAHQDHFQGFEEGVQKLSKSLRSMADAMDDFATNLEQASSDYEATDESASEDVGQSGEK
ncbi:type VII secretion target [Salinifilum ghardaiensis]